MDPFAAMFEPSKPHQNIFEMKSDPMFDIMNMMKPQHGMPKPPMTHWAHQFKMPAFEQPNLDFSNFKLF